MVVIFIVQFSYSRGGFCKMLQVCATTCFRILELLITDDDFHNNAFDNKQQNTSANILTTCSSIIIMPMSLNYITWIKVWEQIFNNALFSGHNIKYPFINGCCCSWVLQSSLTSQVIKVAFYIEREMSDKFCSEAPISAWGTFTCRKSTTWDERLYFSSEGSHTQDFYALKKSIDPSWVWTCEPRIQWRVWIPRDHQGRQSFLR